MKIAIDTGPLKTGDSIRGIGVYTRELAAALESFRKIGKSNFEIHAIDYFNNQSLTANHYDTIHFTRFNPFRISVPFKKPIGTKFVLTIYDLIPLIYPDHYPPGVKGKINWEINKHLIRKNVDSIVTISVTSKKDICRFIGVDPRIVHVTHLAPRQNFEKLDDGDWKKGIKSKYNLPDHFALYVGDINYNKNIPCLIEATKLAGIPLVIAGKQAVEVENMNLKHPEVRHLKKVNFKDVIRTGYISDSELIKIYNLADVYIQTSLYEGFGLPLLEAQATGTPVVAAKTQALVEIAEDSAIFADPKDAKDFAAKIKSIMNDPVLKKKTIEDGLTNAKRYSWKKTAEITLKVYNA